MDGPNPELLAVYGTDEVYLENLEKRAGDSIFGARTRALSQGDYGRMLMGSPREQVRVDRFRGDADMMNQKFRALEHQIMANSIENLGGPGTRRSVFTRAVMTQPYNVHPLMMSMGGGYGHGMVPAPPPSAETELPMADLGAEMVNTAAVSTAMAARLGMKLAHLSKVAFDSSGHHVDPTGENFESYYSSNRRPNPSFFQSPHDTRPQLSSEALRRVESGKDELGAHYTTLKLPVSEALKEERLAGDVREAYGDVRGRQQKERGGRTLGGAVGGGLLGTGLGALGGALLGDAGTGALIGGGLGAATGGGLGYASSPVIKKLAQMGQYAAPDAGVYMPPPPMQSSAPSIGHDLVQGGKEVGMGAAHMGRGVTRAFGKAVETGGNLFSRIGKGVGDWAMSERRSTPKWGTGMAPAKDVNEYGVPIYG